MISEKLSTDSRRMLQNGVPQFVGFCRCTPCRQRRGKVACILRRKAIRRMHPVQAAPRQSVSERWLRTGQGGCTPCRQRRGKGYGAELREQGGLMHPVQAAPRQRSSSSILPRRNKRCTPCRQRRGKDPRKNHHLQRYSRCTPCRQRRGKDRI